MKQKHIKLFIFGSTGDLVKRKVVPAISALRGFDLTVVTLGRKDHTDQSYRNFVCDGECDENFSDKHVYVKIDMENGVECQDCLLHLDKKGVNYFYSALPPANIADVVRYLGRLKRDGYRIKLLVEKPFGTSLKDAVNLKKLIAKEKMTEDVLVSDHYLFKKEVMARKPRAFKKLEIVSLEKVGLERRAGYYDGVGALKDMVQSHFFNIAFRLMKNPAKSFAVPKVLVYERGQYGDGKGSGKGHDYVRDLGKPSDTETFAHVVMKAGGREFDFVTGKMFVKKTGYISIDGKTIHFNSADNPYVRLLEDFFLGKKDHFATIDESILGWKLTEAIQKKTSKLSFY